MFGSRPQLSKEKTAALRNAILKRWKRQRTTPSKLQTIYPEQGSFCSHIYIYISIYIYLHYDTRFLNIFSNNLPGAGGPTAERGSKPNLPCHGGGRQGPVPVNRSSFWDLHRCSTMRMWIFSSRIGILAYFEIF